MHRASRVTAGRLRSHGARGARGHWRARRSLVRGTAHASAAAARTPQAGSGRSYLERPRPIRAPERPLGHGWDRQGPGPALGRPASADADLPPESTLLLDAGGDIVAAGAREPPGTSGSRIRSPSAPKRRGRSPSSSCAVGAIATSSVGIRRWQAPDGAEVHHLIDPVTRAPARTGLIAVTVAVDDPAWAEVWTKALFLAGREGIRDEARGRGLAAWWIDVDGRLGMTPAARAQTSWVDETRVS